MVNINIPDIDREIYELRAFKRAVVDRDVINDVLARALGVMTPEQLQQAGFAPPAAPTEAVSEPTETPVSEHRNGKASREAVASAQRAEGGT